MAVGSLRREACCEVVKEDVDDGRGVEGEDLAEEQATDHGDAERTAQLRTNAVAKGEREAPEKGGHGGHHDGTEAQKTSVVDGFGGVLAVLSLAFEGKVHHHDAVFLNDTDEQDESYDGDDAEGLMEKKQ